MFDSHKYLAIFNPQALDQFRHIEVYPDFRAGCLGVIFTQFKQLCYAAGRYHISDLA